MTRLVCRFRGHVERVVMLPEDLFGPYVYSRIECSRCGAVLETGMTQAAQINRLVEIIDEFQAAIGPFAGLLETEWYNGNLAESAYGRLDAELTGLSAKYRHLAGPVEAAA